MKLYIDASYHAIKKISAYSVVDEAGNSLASGHELNSTSQRGELLALIACLELKLDDQLLIHSDSKYSVGIYTGAYKKLIRNTDLVDKIINLKDNNKKVRWISRTYNHLADQASRVVLTNLLAQGDLA